MLEEKTTESQTRLMTDTDKLRNLLNEHELNILRGMRKMLDDDRNRWKRVIFKALSNLLGIFKDPEA